MTAKRIAEIRRDALNYAGPKKLLDIIEELCKSVEQQTEKRNGNNTQKATEAD